MRNSTLVGLLTVSLVAAAIGAGGCGEGFGSLRSGNYVKPTVAVMKFENRAPFPLNWDLGGGMREILVDRLVATKRYQVVERPELGFVVGELQLQQAGVTRPEGRAEPNRLKNVQYLVKGTVTDFGHVSTNRGFLGLPSGDVFGGTNRAVMGITLYVVDVESGEIITSESLEESVRASDVSVQGAYKDVAFGGSVFYQTPLGRATAKVIDKAVKRITTTIAASPWKPKVALVRADGTVVLNGGRDRGVRRGTEYDVVEPGEPILDPDTGDRLGHAAFRSAGRIRIREVYPAYSAADVVRGVAEDFRPGLLCRKADSTPAPFEP